MTETFHSVPQVAKRLQVSKARVYQFIEAGRLKAIRVPGEQRDRLFVAESAVAEFLATAEYKLK